MNSCKFRLAGFVIVISSLGSWAPAFCQDVLVADAQASLIQNTTIAAPMAGVLQTIVVVEGDRVTSGTVLASIDDSEARADVVAATAALEAAVVEAENDVDQR